MRKVVASVMLVALAAPLLGGCSSWFDRAQAARSQPAVKAAPMSPHEAALMAGKDALREGQYAAAITDFRIARLDPALEAESLNGLAIAYSNIGRPDLSERYFREAVALAPDDRRFAANLARFRAISGKAPAQPAPAEALARADAASAPQPALVLAGGAVVASAPALTGSGGVTSRAPDPSGPVRVVISGPAAPSAAVAVRVSAPAPALAAASVAAKVQTPVQAAVNGRLAAPVAVRAEAPVRPVVVTAKADAPARAVAPARAPAPAGRPSAVAAAVVAMARPAASGQVAIAAPAIVLSRVAANEVVIGAARSRPAVAARAPLRPVPAVKAAPVRRLAMADRPVVVQALYRSERPGRAIGY